MEAANAALSPGKSANVYRKICEQIKVATLWGEKPVHPTSTAYQKMAEDNVKDIVNSQSPGKETEAGH